MRSDKRRHDQLRPIIIKLNTMRFAEGSCTIQVGHTQVLCTASVEEKVPAWMKGKGKGWVTAEYAMLPRSCQQRIPRDISKGKIDGRSQEIQRLIGRSMRSIVDLEALGERTVWLDCDVLQGDGGTRCASITGAYVALELACKKLIKEGLLKKSPLRDHVAAISVGIHKGESILDLCYEEDSRAEVDMNLVMTGSGKFIEIQGTAEREPFSDAQLKKLMALGKAGIQQLVREQKKVLKS